MGELVDQKFRLIAFTSIVGLLIADSKTAISGPETHSGGDQPEPHIKISPIGEIHQRFKRQPSELLITNLNSLNEYY